MRRELKRLKKVHVTFADGTTKVYHIKDPDASFFREVTSYFEEDDSEKVAGKIIAWEMRWAESRPL